jgi:hypothetical protein
VSASNTGLPGERTPSSMAQGAAADSGAWAASVARRNCASMKVLVALPMNSVRSAPWAARQPTLAEASGQA